MRLTSPALAPPGWPQPLDGLRVAVIADLHTGAPHVSLSKVERVVARVNRERPDLVVLLGDYVDRRVAGATPVPISAAALAAPPDDVPVLLLSHNPDVFPEVPERVSLTLSGHTHGAQVDLPLVRDRVTPSRFGAHYTGGVFEEGGRLLFVSRGVGTSSLPVRFLAPPEVAVVELTTRS